MGAPFFWVFGIGMMLGACLHKGAALLTIGKHDHDKALALMENERATHIGLWPTTRQKLDHHVAVTGHDVSRIPAYAAAKAGRIDFGTPPGHNSLGMTETCGPHCGPPLEEFGKAVPASLAGSFGKPFAGIEYKVVDVETGKPVAPGEEGKLCVRSYSLMQGLYKLERHETFDEDGWLHTGDRVLLREGYLFFTGRHSEMIKTSGANVAPGEVEAALWAAPGVGFAIVIGLPDAERGEIVGAVLVPRPAMTLELAAIKAKVESLLSGYKQPRRYLLLGVDELPYLASGKPDKRKLKEWLIERGC
jgi:acyl-CoA synthetase (AMP-forming)/AMP-acid ligase II